MARSIDSFEGISRWNFDLEGSVCPCCNGNGEILESRDLHRSEGIIPCPIGYFQGHGYPTCIEGRLHFSDYDRKNKSRIIKTNGYREELARHS